MTNRITMKEMPLSERPSEKCQEYGAESLTDKELLTVLIRSGNKDKRADEIALNLIEMCGSDGLYGMFEMSVNDFMKIPGIGKVKATQLSCVLELCKRLQSGKKLWGNKFSSAQQIGDYYVPRLSGLRKEQLHILIMDIKNRIIKDEILSVGNISSSICDPREILSATLKHNGVKIILMHNHPSGDPTPSEEDLMITERVYKACSVTGIALLDHIIIGGETYVSLKGDGYYGF